MSIRRWIAIALVIALVVSAVWFFMRRPATNVVAPAPPAPTSPAPVKKKAVVKPAVVVATPCNTATPQQAAPAAAQTIINVYGCCMVAPASGSIATPPPPQFPCSEADQYQCGGPPPPSSTPVPRSSRPMEVVS